MAATLTNRGQERVVLSDNRQDGLYRSSIKLAPGASITITDDQFLNIQPLPATVSFTLSADQGPIDSIADVEAIVDPAIAAHTADPDAHHTPTAPGSPPAFLGVHVGTGGGPILVPIPPGSIAVHWSATTLGAAPPPTIAMITSLGACGIEGAATIVSASAILTGTDVSLAGAALNLGGVVYHFVAIA